MDHCNLCDLPQHHHHRRAPPGRPLLHRSIHKAPPLQAGRKKHGQQPCAGRGSGNNRQYSRNPGSPVHRILGSKRKPHPKAVLHDLLSLRRRGAGHRLQIRLRLQRHYHKAPSPDHARNESLLVWRLRRSALCHDLCLHLQPHHIPDQRHPGHGLPRNRGGPP